MTIDWTKFRKGDRVRVTFEGEWTRFRNGAETFSAGTFVLDGCHLAEATSAELIERPFTPPEAGKLFRSLMGAVYISDGPNGYYAVRRGAGDVVVNRTPFYRWGEDTTTGWRESIEVLDV